MLRTILFLTLAGLATAAYAQPAPVRPDAAERAARIEQLIRQLGDDSFQKREAATKALLSDLGLAK